MVKNKILPNPSSDVDCRTRLVCTARLVRSPSTDDDTWGTLVLNCNRNNQDEKRADHGSVHE